MADCPRCRQALVVNQVDEFEVRICPPCRGALVRHRDLQAILDRSWRSVAPAEAEQRQFLATDTLQTERAVGCPDCYRPMEKYGYMGLAAIPMDRCDRCALVWLDADELQNMVVALAKSNYRSERARQREAETYLKLGTVGVPTQTDEWTKQDLRLVAVQTLLRLLLR